jgi:septal ring-binding cell division protein DamX
VVSLHAVESKEVYSLKDVIAKKQNNYYTIVLATLLPTLDYQKIIAENNIGYNAVAYNFGQQDKYVKILFGAYKSYEEALDSLVKLNTSLLANKPYIEKTEKHITLFHKYNNPL